MNIFKQAQIKAYTYYELNATDCVCISRKNKKECKRICNKKARRKLNREVLKARVD